MNRTLLAGPLSMYVNVTTGDDGNDYLSPSTAAKTIQAAVMRALAWYDLSIWDLQINIAPGI